MEWIERFNASLRYLEEHLPEDIDDGQLARIACCSLYHYQRMFTCLAGVSLGEYIRRRRMSLAAADLQAGGRVIDVAAKYGYQSPTAFHRAFRAIHGVAPSAVREAGTAVRAYPPLEFRLTVRGAAALEYRIETRPAFRIAGVSIPLAQNIEENFETVPALWARAAADGTVARLAARMQGPPMGLLGVSACGDGAAWRYYIAVAAEGDCAPFETAMIPAATWAIFPGSGDHLSIQDLERRVVTEWLPGSGYEYADAPDIEVYLNPDPQNAAYEVWIPVVKAK